MRHIATAIQNRDGRSLQRIYAAAEQPKQAVPEQAAQVFNELFRQLKGAFPALMAQIKTQDELNELRRQWVLAFAENGIITIAQVNAGMRIARQQETPFLPSPGQFVAWCREGEASKYGLPDADQLYDMVMDYSARRGLFDGPEHFPWQSNECWLMVPALYSQMRSGNLTASELRQKCVKELRKMTQRLDAGEKIGAPVAQLPVLTCPLSNEKGLDRIAEIRRKFGMRVKP